MNPRTKPPKVVIVSTVHRATDDRIFHKQARSLAKAGYKVVLFGNAPNDLFTDGVRIRALRKAVSRLARRLGSFKILSRILSEQGDIYHFHDPELIPAGFVLRLLGRRVIYDVHEDYPKDVLEKPYLPRRLRPLLSAGMHCLEKCAARSMSAVITATRAIQRRFPGSIAVHNYPVLECPTDSRQAPRERPLDDLFVTYFGTITSSVGAREMVAAVSLACKRHRVRLRMLGPFQDENLRSEILGGGSRRVVDYRGILPVEQVFQHYQGALAGLLILHPILKLKESMPVKMFECMACGVPLIASDFPLWRQIIYDQGCGLVVNPLDVEEVANAIIYLIEHSEEARKMGERGKELARTKYNWESESKKLLALYDRLLKEGSQRSCRHGKGVQPV